MHHQPLARGTFGPTFTTRGGDEVPTLDIGNSSSPDIVDTLIRSFPAGTTELRALATVRAGDLPADARLVGTSLPDRTCKVLTYRSRTLAASGPYEDFGNGSIRVTLISELFRPSARYTADNVEQAYEQVYPTSAAQCS